jgi:hypothetical protein
VAGESRPAPPGGVRTCRSPPLDLPGVVVEALGHRTCKQARRGLKAPVFFELRLMQTRVS